MNVTLKPEAREFIEQQVKAGFFRSADDVLDEAVSRMMSESGNDLDDDTAEAINRAEEQIDRGEGIEFDQFAADFRKRIGGT